MHEELATKCSVFAGKTTRVTEVVAEIGGFASESIDVASVSELPLVN
jgi:hypothetical protein